jgi:hypothetical protein
LMLKNRHYHLRMLLSTLYRFNFPNAGDTRNYLDVDETERDILVELITTELNRMDPA